MKDKINFHNSTVGFGQKNKKCKYYYVIDMDISYNILKFNLICIIKGLGDELGN